MDEPILNGVKILDTSLDNPPQLLTIIADLPPDSSFILDARHHARLLPSWFELPGADQVRGRMDVVGMMVLVDHSLDSDEEAMLIQLAKEQQGLVIAVLSVGCNGSLNDQQILDLALTAGQAAMPAYELLVKMPPPGGLTMKQSTSGGRDFGGEVSAIVQEILGHSVNLDEPLMDAGLTSQDAVTLVTTLEDTLGISLPGTLAFDFPSVAAISGYLNSSVDDKMADAGGADDREDSTLRLSEVVKEAVAALLGRDVGDEEPLMQAGLTSADAVTLVGTLEESIGAVLPSTLIFDFPCVEAISSFLASEYGNLSASADEPGPAANVLSSPGDSRDFIVPGVFALYVPCLCLFGAHCRFGMHYFIASITQIIRDLQLGVQTSCGSFCGAVPGGSSE